MRIHGGGAVILFWSRDKFIEEYMTQEAKSPDLLNPGTHLPVIAANSNPLVETGVKDRRLLHCVDFVTQRTLLKTGASTAQIPFHRNQPRVSQTGLPAISRKSWQCLLTFQVRH